MSVYTDELIEREAKNVLILHNDNLVESIEFIKEVLSTIPDSDSNTTEFLNRILSYLEILVKKKMLNS